MKTYSVNIGIGLYCYEIKAKSLKEAKKKAKKLCIYNEKINWIYLR